MDCRVSYFLTKDSPMDPIYVFGHRNPDTDAICSAIAYAYFKNRLAPGHVPVRLGNLNAETRFVLEHWDVEEPELLPHLHLRVQDVMSRNIKSAPINATVYEVGELMRQAEVQAIPLVDASGRARGVVTEGTPAPGTGIPPRVAGAKRGSKPRTPQNRANFKLAVWWWAEAIPPSVVMWSLQR